MSQPKWVLPLSLATVLLLVGAGSPLPEADRYTWETVVADGGPGLEPVAATRCDRDRDGNPDLAIAYGGDGRGALVWIPIHASRLGAPEPPLELPFEPTAMVAGDLDADGREELALTVTGTPVLAVVAVAADGEVGAPTFSPAARGATAPRPRGPATPRRAARAAGGPRRPPAGGRQRPRRPGRRCSRLAASPPRSRRRRQALRNGVRLLLATRIDADASPELVVAAPDGSVRVGTLIRATVVVDTTDDSVDFGGAQQVADLPGPDGKTTLREAIIAANNTAGPHSIQFNIPQTGNDFHDNAWWISPSDGNLGPLPAITTWGVTVDGGSQTANQGDTNPVGPELVLDGSGLAGGPGVDGFTLQAPFGAVVDFVVQNFDPAGVGVQVGGDYSVVKGCYLGTDPTGTQARGNTHGVMVHGTGVLVGGTGTHGAPPVPDGNVISGNVLEGVHLGGAISTRLEGNRIGTSPDGYQGVPNVFGLWIFQATTDTTVGGTAAGAGNLISATPVRGSTCARGHRRHPDQGNLIGSDASGLAALPNGSGVQVERPRGTTIGGTSPAARNVISGNAGDGVRIQDPGTDGTVVQGNWIGLDASGSSALPNQALGISVFNGATNTTIGGGEPGEGNVISGNITRGHRGVGTGHHRGGHPGQLDRHSTGVGVHAPSATRARGSTCSTGAPAPVYGALITDNVVSGNERQCRLARQRVPRQPGRRQPHRHRRQRHPGPTERRRRLRPRLLDNQISGPRQPHRLLPRRRRLHPRLVGREHPEPERHPSNDGLGIDLGEDGVTANDVGDDDEGPNRLVNYPVLAERDEPLRGGHDGRHRHGGHREPATRLGGAFRVGCPSTRPASARGGASSAPPPRTSTAASASPCRLYPSGTSSPRRTPTRPATPPSSRPGCRCWALRSRPSRSTPTSPPDRRWTSAGSTRPSTSRASELERRAAGGSFALLTALPADSTSYHDPGPLAAGSTYYYRVRAQASGCVSAWSNVASVTVPGATSAFCRSRVTHFTNAQNPHLEYGDGFFGATWRDCSGGTCTLVYARLDAAGAILEGPVVAAGGDGSTARQSRLERRRVGPPLARAAGRPLGALLPAPRPGRSAHRPAGQGVRGGGPPGDHQRDASRPRVGRQRLGPGLGRQPQRHPRRLLRPPRSERARKPETCWSATAPPR